MALRVLQFLGHETETTYRFNIEYFFQLWKPIFKLEDLVFNVYYSSSMY